MMHFAVCRQCDRTVVCEYKECLAPEFHFMYFAVCDDCKELKGNPPSQVVTLEQITEPIAN